MPSTADPDDLADRLVRTAAAQLYAGPPAEFIATRTALVKSAKAEGEKEAAKAIGALRRPSVAAWALNQVVHRGDPVIQELADLGARLRHATSALDAAGIAGLRRPRDAALAALVEAASEVAAEAGQRLTAAVEAEVRDTGIAALADEAAEAVLRSGTLTRALSYSGFGEVDLSEAAATTSTGVVLTSLPGGRAKPTVAARAGKVATPQEAPDQDEPEEVPEGGDENEDEQEEVPEGEDEQDQDEDEQDQGEDEDHGAEALAEAAAAEERERRLAQAERALETATKEVGRRRAAVDAARNRSEATRQRVQKLEAQLEKARAEDDLALAKLTEALGAAKGAERDATAARESVAELSD